MTVRLFPDGQIAIASLSFGVDISGGVEGYWEAVGIFVYELRPLVDEHGLVGQLLITNESTTLFGMMAPGFTREGLVDIMTPLLSSLASGVITAAEQLGLTIDDDQSYYKLYSRTVEPLTANNLLSPVIGGRFVTRENMDTNSTAVLAAIRKTVDGGKFYVAASAMHANGAGRIAEPVADNAMQPALNNAFLSLIIPAVWSWDTPWDEASMLQDEFMQVVKPDLEDATPGAGVYVNEANWGQATREDFWGEKYERLRAIKREYDPHNLFYALTGVGSEAWAADAEGRLCRVEE